MEPMVTGARTPLQTENSMESNRRIWNIINENGRLSKLGLMWLLYGCNKIKEAYPSIKQSFGETVREKKPFFVSKVVSKISGFSFQMLHDFWINYRRQEKDLKEPSRDRSVPGLKLMISHDLCNITTTQNMSPTNNPFIFALTREREKKRECVAWVCANVHACICVCGWVCVCVQARETIKKIGKTKFWIRLELNF